MEDFSKSSSRYIVRIEQKYLKQLDYFTRIENWGLISSEISVLKYDEFSLDPKNQHRRNNYTSSPLFVFTKLHDNKLDVKDAEHNSLLLTLKGDEEFTNIFSFD